jgi:hypothetical protein
MPQLRQEGREACHEERPHCCKALRTLPRLNVHSTSIRLQRSMHQSRASRHTTVRQSDYRGQCTRVTLLDTQSGQPSGPPTVNTSQECQVWWVYRMRPRNLLLSSTCGANSRGLISRGMTFAEPSDHPNSAHSVGTNNVTLLYLHGCCMS